MAHLGEGLGSYRHPMRHGSSCKLQFLLRGGFNQTTFNVAFNVCIIRDIQTLDASCLHDANPNANACLCSGCRLPMLSDSCVGAAHITAVDSCQNMLPVCIWRALVQILAPAAQPQVLTCAIPVLVSSTSRPVFASGAAVQRQEQGPGQSSAPPPPAQLQLQSASPMNPARAQPSMPSAIAHMAGAPNPFRAVVTSEQPPAAKPMFSGLNAIVNPFRSPSSSPPGPPPHDATAGAGTSSPASKAPHPFAGLTFGTAEPSTAAAAGPNQRASASGAAAVGGASASASDVPNPFAAFPAFALVGAGRRTAAPVISSQQVSALPATGSSLPGSSTPTSTPAATPVISTVASPVIGPHDTVAPTLTAAAAHSRSSIPISMAPAALATAQEASRASNPAQAETATAFVAAAVPSLASAAVPSAAAATLQMVSTPAAPLGLQSFKGFELSRASTPSVPSVPSAAALPLASITASVPTTAASLLTTSVTAAVPAAAANLSTPSVTAAMPAAAAKLSTLSVTAAVPALAAKLPTLPVRAAVPAAAADLPPASRAAALPAAAVHLPPASTAAAGPAAFASLLQASTAAAKRPPASTATAAPAANPPPSLTTAAVPAAPASLLQASAAAPVPAAAAGSRPASKRKWDVMAQPQPDAATATTAVAAAPHAAASGIAGGLPPPPASLLPTGCTTQARSDTLATGTQPPAVQLAIAGPPQDGLVAVGVSQTGLVPAAPLPASQPLTAAEAAQAAASKALAGKDLAAKLAAGFAQQHRSKQLAVTTAAGSIGNQAAPVDASVAIKAAAAAAAEKVLQERAAQAKAAAEKHIHQQALKAKHSVHSSGDVHAARMEALRLRNAARHGSPQEPAVLPTAADQVASTAVVPEPQLTAQAAAAQHPARFQHPEAMSDDSKSKKRGRDEDQVASAEHGTETDLPGPPADRVADLSSRRRERADSLASAGSTDSLRRQGRGHSSDSRQVWQTSLRLPTVGSGSFYAG